MGIAKKLNMTFSFHQKIIRFYFWIKRTRVSKEHVHRTCWNDLNAYWVNCCRIAIEKKYCSNRLLFNNATLDICKKKNLCLQEFRKCQCIYTPEAWLWRSARHFFDYVIVNCSNSSMAKCTIVDAIPKPRFL